MSGRPPSRSSHRPPSARPMSSAGRPPSSSGRPPGTASRLVTAANQRPGSRGASAGVVGGGVVLNQHIDVKDRPMTQQGLGGLRPTTGGFQRQVMDKSYYAGLLRAKLADISKEAHRLGKENDASNAETQNFRAWEKRAEQLAQDIKDMQGRLSDLNTVNDKLSIDASVDDLEDEISAITRQNERETSVVESIFQEKVEKEQVIRKLESEIEREKKQAENILHSMSEEERARYEQLKSTNESLESLMENLQRTLGTLQARCLELKEEMAQDSLKEEALELHEKLNQLVSKRDEMIAEETARADPQQEREKILSQVKSDNQEIGAMEKTIRIAEGRIHQLSSRQQPREEEQDGEESVAERLEKYRELRKKEEGMDDFLSNFETLCLQEVDRNQKLEEIIVQLLLKIGQNHSYYGHLPSNVDYTKLSTDLQSKETEVGKAELTSQHLELQLNSMRDDLQKTEQLETKIQQELVELDEHLEKMRDEMKVFEDLDALQQFARDRESKLLTDKESLQLQVQGIKAENEKLIVDHDQTKKTLQDNDTYVQLTNLERKLQHIEQNNFAMREYIAQKKAETDFTITKQNVLSNSQEYNKFLQNHVVKYGGAVQSFNE